jgi:hypothetical protein
MGQNLSPSQLKINRPEPDTRLDPYRTGSVGQMRSKGVIGMPDYRAVSRGSSSVILA